MGPLVPRPAPRPRPSDRTLVARSARRPRLPVALRALALPNYRRWAVADLVSNTGSWMSTAALGWLAAGIFMGAIVRKESGPPS